MYNNNNMNDKYKQYNIEALQQLELASTSQDRKPHRKLNYFVMQHTYNCCAKNSDLSKAVENSISKQRIIFESNIIQNEYAPNKSQQVLVTCGRTFETAKKYKGKRTAVLNFANNHSVGGAPFSAGAQEESLCRCSTLYPCLENATEFYESHKQKYRSGKMNALGNDDIIYTPDVVVFKTDESAPLMMEEEDWYKVDIITCAAPELRYYKGNLDNLESIIGKRIKRILDVAALNKVEVLILGAFGCGAFKNPPEVVARLFKEQIKNYPFEVVDFAVTKGKSSPSNYDIFKEIIEGK